MPRFTTRPEIVGTFGVVTSTHWVATAIGMGVLEKGGNAFDAAVATGFALQVLEPHLNGPGGDAPIILNDARTKRTEVICGQGVAPALATIDAFRKLDLDLVPGTGLLPAVVPGSFDAWMLLLRDHGTLPLADVLGPTIALARDGYPVAWRIPVAIDTVKDFFLEHWPTNAAVWLKGGKAPEAGSLHTNPTLAATYARVLKEADAAGGSREKRIEAARRAWYQGFVADAIDKFYSSQSLMDVSGRRNKGLLRGQDLARWQARKEAPLALDYGRYRVFKCGAWSQGPAALQQLALLKSFGLDGMEPTSPDWVHTVVECAKLAFADREAYYGDPDFVDVPVEALLSAAYNEARAKLVGRQASMELRPGAVGGKARQVDFEAAIRRAAKAKGGGVGEPTLARGVGEPTLSKAHTGHGADELKTTRAGATQGDTCHLDVIDRHGNMVSATPSGGWLQSSPTIPELGFNITTRGQMFWLDAKEPGALEPGKRPRTTLTPGLAERDGEPYLAWGTPGGDQQDQWTVQMLLRHAHAGMNLQEAIDCPAFHSEHFPISFYPRTARPGVVLVEGRMPKETVEELRRRGHIVEVGEDWSEGRLTAASREGRLIKAAANARGMQGYAAGR